MDKLPDIVGDEITWREAMAAKYTMRFDLRFLNPKEAGRVWDALGVDDAAAPQDGLRASWVSLPRCPDANQHLPLFGAKDTTTRYALNVTMGWGTKDWLPRTGNGKRKRMGTPLECSNHFKRQKSNGQLPTPVSTPRSGTSIASTDTMIRYHLNGSLVEKHGYWCIICANRELSSLDRLEFHLAQAHPLFEFSIESDSTNRSVVDDSPVDIIIKGNVGMKHKSRERAKGAVDRNDSVIDELDWHTHYPPYSPLSFQQVLRDPQWSLGGIQKQRDTPQPQSVPSFAPVAEVELELPIRTKRAVPVAPHPKQEGVLFLSSDNKAALQTGEILSDDDDQVLEMHLEVARRVELTAVVLDAKQRNFLLDMNAHIESEGPRADKLLGPCLRRWLHKRRQALKNDMTARMFEEFIYAAWKKDYISEEMYTSCMDMSKEIRNTPTLPEETVLFAQKTPMRVRGKEDCICHRKVEILKTRVDCANKVCFSLLRYT
jgi:hypothetical protein